MYMIIILSQGILVLIIIMGDRIQINLKLSIACYQPSCRAQGHPRNFKIQLAFITQIYMITVYIFLVSSPNFSSTNLAVVV